ncbi:MAG: patatin-like phospholipase family protein [Chloroflexi bacterium]|nr:patatin-like phospholipase family protein [Chloroflexota bacterium]
MPEKFKADAVFEGGGVKGIALLGALSVMEEAWSWENVGGTSAGAIVAAFTATGMAARDIRRVLDSIDLQEIMDTGWEDRLDWWLSRLSPLRLVSPLGVAREHLFSVLKEFGIFEGRRFMELVNDHLPTGKHTFGDLLYDPDAPKDSPYRYKLRVVASDLTAHRMVVLPQDIVHYGLDPDGLPIAEALRMSMSIPIFFEPWKLKDTAGRVHHVVDGGILSNYPIWMFDAPPGEEPAWPTFGFDLYSPADKADGHPPWPAKLAEINSIFHFGKTVWDTLFSAMDRRYIARRHWARTVAIDGCGIPTTKFALTPEEKEALWQSGVRAARAFMEQWGDPEAGFRRWKAQYRREVEEAQRLARERRGAFSESSFQSPHPLLPHAPALQRTCDRRR